MDLALNNLQRLICHKTQQTKPNFDLKFSLDSVGFILSMENVMLSELTKKGIMLKNKYFFIIF